MLEPLDPKSLTQPRIESLKRALLTWGIWRTALSIWGYTIWRMGFILPDAGREWLHGFRPASEGLRAALVDLWMRWDTVHYLRIIRDGYGPDERSAFFPLYPYLGEIFGALAGSDGLIGLLLVSNLAAVGCFYLLDRLTYSLNSIPSRSSLLKDIVFYPAAFLLLVAYPQSLVLFFSLAAYLAQRNQRIALAFVFGLAAGLTHSTALPLVVLLLIDASSDRGRRKLWWLTSLAPLLGIAGFMAWRSYAGYPSIQTLLSAIWGKTISAEIDLKGVMSPWIWFARGWPNLLVFLLGVAGLAWTYRSKLYHWTFFLAALLVIPVITAPSFEPLAGMARYVLVGFPIFFTLSSWLPKGWKRLALLTLAIGANLYLSGLFLVWGFIG